jgi:hypothetical protein
LPNQEKKFAIISNNSTIREKAKIFFESNIFSNLLGKFTNSTITCELYESEEVFINQYTKLDGRSFIGGV